MDLITVIDCTGAALSGVSFPSGSLAAGYVTGFPPVPWTDQQFAAHPGAVRIDQSPIDTPADETADVYDMEQRAGTLTGLPTWVHGAWNSYTNSNRPGQRKPCSYQARSNVTPTVNTLLAAGITMGVNLWVAAQMTVQQARALVLAGSGPFPIVGVQYDFQADHDVSVVSADWLNDVSGKPAGPVPGPGSQGDWRHCLKCTSLFYGPQQAVSVCAAGGQHSGTQSHAFTLNFSV